MKKIEMFLKHYHVDYKLYDNKKLIYADSLIYPITSDRNDDYENVIANIKKDILGLIDVFVKKDNYRKSTSKCRFVILNTYAKNITDDNLFYDVAQKTEGVIELFDENGSFITVSDIMLRKIAEEYYSGNISFRSIISKYGVNSSHINEAIHKYSALAKHNLASNERIATILHTVSSVFNVNEGFIKNVLGIAVNKLTKDNFIIYYITRQLFKEYNISKSDIVLYLDSTENIESDNISTNYKESVKLKEVTKYKSIFEDADKKIVELLNIIKSYGTR